MTTTTPGPAPTASLPALASSPGPGREWNEIVLGVDAAGQQVIWDVNTTPHALICGASGSGKSVMQQVIALHCLEHADQWRIIFVNTKAVDLRWLPLHPSVLKIANDFPESVEVLTAVRDEMRRRYNEMAGKSVQTFLALPAGPPAVMLVVDETYPFFSDEGADVEDRASREPLRVQAQLLLTEVARFGRAAGVFIVAATQVPAALTAEFINNLECRIVCGPVDAQTSLTMVGSKDATRLPAVPGRALVRLGMELTEFQGYSA